MKKKLLIFSLILLPAVSYGQLLYPPGIIQGLVDSCPGRVVANRWQEGEWRYDHERRIKYNQMNQIDQVIKSTEGQPDIRTVYFYNDEDKLAQTLIQQKVGGLWLNLTRTVLSDYHADDPALIEYQKYISGVWMTQWGFRTDFEYKPGGLDSLVFQETYFEFSQGDGHYYPIYRHTYDYDSNLLEKTELIEEYSADEKWENMERHYYSWDPQKRINILLWDKWEDESWQPDGRIQYWYSEYGSVQSIQYEWDEDNKVYNGKLRSTFEYDSHGTTILSTIEDRTGIEWIMTSGNRWIPVYDESRMVERIMQTWETGQPAVNSSGGFWENNLQEFFSDFLNLGIDNPSSLSTHLVIYPCPATDKRIRISGYVSSEPIEVIVINSLGQIILRQFATQIGEIIEVDLTGQAAGLYSIRISGAKGNPAIGRVIIN